MKTPLGTAVDTGHVVLDGFPELRERGTAPPLFYAHVYCGHGHPSQLLLSSWCNGCGSTFIFCHYVLVNLNSVIDNETSVLSSTCDSPTDAISEWTLILCAGVLSQRLAADVYCQVILWVFRYGHHKYLRQWTEIMPMSLDDYCLCSCFEWLSLGSGIIAVFEHNHFMW